MGSCTAWSAYHPVVGHLSLFALPLGSSGTGAIVLLLTEREEASMRAARIVPVGHAWSEVGPESTDDLSHLALAWARDELTAIIAATLPDPAARHLVPVVPLAEGNATTVMRQVILRRRHEALVRRLPYDDAPSPFEDLLREARARRYDVRPISDEPAAR